MKVKVLTRNVEASVTLSGAELADLETEYWLLVARSGLVPNILRLVEALIGHPDD